VVLNTHASFVSALLFFPIAGLALFESLNAQSGLGPKFHPVQPVHAAAGVGEQLAVKRGQFFTYALPPHWRVGEEGQFAVSLLAPENRAMTVMVGNSGFAPNYPPDRFVSEKLSAMRIQNLQLTQGVRAQPIAGFQTAYQYGISYSSKGLLFRGAAKCSIAQAYDSAVLVMTLAVSRQEEWAEYSKWLPAAADQIAASNGAAFGRRGIMAQNLQNSKEYGEAARQYREWSQKNWQQVTDQRSATQDKQNSSVRENLGSVQTYTNPYDSSQPLELPLTYKYFWVDRQGKIVGTDDPSANPNTGSTGDWRQMPRSQPR